MTDSGVGNEQDTGAAVFREFRKGERQRRRSVRFFERVFAVATAVLAAVALATQIGVRPVPSGDARADGLPVFAHYLPWYSSPTTLGPGKWGWHWTMDTRDPNMVESDGRRQIASHEYPAIGPYDSADPAVLRYQLLLMKYAGIDGVLIDWYGTAGTNSDLPVLRRNTDLLIQQAEAIGLRFALVYEDRFARGPNDVRASLTYARDHYFPMPQYVRLASTKRPYLGVFGPISSVSAEAWQSIVRAMGPVDLRTLWNNDRAGSAADGQFTWPYSVDGDWDRRLEQYAVLSGLANRRVTAVAFPGFHDYYAQGQQHGTSLFTIPSDGVGTLQRTLAIAAGSRTVDSLQIATWNDYGEGTVVEPTVQEGFRPLEEIQRFTQTRWTAADLQTVLAWYRAQTQGQPAAEQAYTALVGGKPEAARTALGAAT